MFPKPVKREDAPHKDDPRRWVYLYDMELPAAREGWYEVVSGCDGRQPEWYMCREDENVECSMIRWRKTDEYQVFFGEDECYRAHADFSRDDRWMQ